MFSTIFCRKHEFDFGGFQPIFAETGFGGVLLQNCFQPIFADTRLINLMLLSFTAFPGQ